MAICKNKKPARTSDNRAYLLDAFGTPHKSPLGGSAYRKLFKDVASKLEYGIIRLHKADKG